MEAQQPQSSDTFDQRMSQWIASQGFWFQLRYSLSGGGGWSGAMFHLLRMFLRLLVVVVLVGIGVLYYLTKRADTPEFREGMEARFAEATGAAEVKILDFQRSQGLGMMRGLAAEGTATSFFNSLEARNLRFEMGLLDGIREEWRPGVIDINSVDAVVKGGANSSEEAGQAIDVLFRETPGFEVDGIRVTRTRLSWGYAIGSEVRNFGKIADSRLEATRVGSSWRLVFRGGTFTQNWMTDFPIHELIFILRPDGLEVEEGWLGVPEGDPPAGTPGDEIKSWKWKVEFQDVRVDGGEYPEFSGKLVFDSVPLETLVAGQLETRIEGRLSGELELSGSTNSAEGVGFKGSFEIPEGAQLAMRDEFALLRTIDVVDAFNNYKRIDFDTGSFDVTTGGGQLELSNVDLAALDEDSESVRIGLTGDVVVRKPTREEAADLAGIEEVVGASSSAMQKKAEAEMSLKRAAAAARKAEGSESGEGTSESLDFFKSLQDDRKELERLRDEASSRFLRTLIFDGSFRLSIPGDAFGRSPALRELHPVNAQTGRIDLVVPLNGPLFSLTEEQADEMYQIDTDSR